MTVERNFRQTVSRLARWLLVPAVVFCTLALPAEEPPRLSRKWLEEAKEKCVIVVEEARVKDISDNRYRWKLVNIKARVEKVERTSTGLRPGMVIYVKYIHTFDKLPGPSSIPVLRKDHRYRAFLNPVEGRIDDRDLLLDGWDRSRQYAPAALGKSFLLIDR